jgi:hypothetical protein
MKSVLVLGLALLPALAAAAPDLPVDGRRLVLRADPDRAASRSARIQLRGTGISISAVGHGQVAVDGTGETGVDDGVISIDDQPYESLPDELTTYLLGTAPPRP